MLVYGHRSVCLSTGDALADFIKRLERLPASPAHDDLRSLLVDWGEIESGVADAFSLERDDELETLTLWRRVSDSLADAMCASWVHDDAALGSALARCIRFVGALRQAPWPADVAVRTAEGFAYHGLYPEQYASAADAFLDACQPRSILCLGLRSIGSILAHVVAAASRLRGLSAHTRSVRPRGHPFNRQIITTARLDRAIAGMNVDYAVIVDEGPGLSGSSFMSAVDYLIGLGLRYDRIVLFPSWPAAARQLRSARARGGWDRQRQFIGKFDALWSSARSSADSGGPVEDLSAGRWRTRVLTDDRQWPPVNPQHERRKFLSGSAPAVLSKFVGLGRRARILERRAVRLAEGGFGPSILGVENGFLRHEWIEGWPIPEHTPDTLTRFARYLAFIRAHFATGEPDRAEEMREMAAVNVREALSPSAVRAMHLLIDGGEAFREPKVAVDGRMLPYEWISTPRGLFKVDALEHHDDDFWPGCRDIAWDVAGTIVEFDFEGAAREFFIAAYERAAKDRTIGRRLPLYEAAYLAYRIGYANLSFTSLQDSDEGPAFSRLEDRYRHLLAARLGCDHRTSPRLPSPAERQRGEKDRSAFPESTSAPRE